MGIKYNWKTIYGIYRPDDAVAKLFYTILQGDLPKGTYEIYIKELVITLREKGKMPTYLLIADELENKDHKKRLEALTTPRYTEFIHQIIKQYILIDKKPIVKKPGLFEKIFGKKQ